MNIPAHFEFFSPRKLPVLALGIVLSLGATVSHVSAQTLFSDNFSSYGTPGAAGVNITTGSPLPVGSTYTGGGLVFNAGTATGTDALAAAAFGGGATNNFGKAGIGTTNLSTNETTQWNLASNSPTNGTLTLTFDFYYVTAAANTAIQFNFYDQALDRESFATGRGLGLFLRSNGTVGTYTGSADGPNLIGTFQMNALQTFSVTFNFATNSYTASIGGATGSGTFLASRDWLKTVWLNDSSGNNVNFYYDNVVIAVPEPGTVGLALGGLTLMVIAARVRRSKLA
jgi:hypothetical protein